MADPLPSEKQTRQREPAQRFPAAFPFPFPRELDLGPAGPHRTFLCSWSIMTLCGLTSRCMTPIL